MTETSITADTTGDVTITRDFDAPRELMFRALVEPEQFIRFWGPTGTHVPLETVVIEPWAGGRFEWAMVPDDDPTSEGFGSKGVFVEVVEPELMTFTEPESGITTRSTFTDLGDGRTRLVIHQTNVPEMYRSPESLAGFNSSLDRLAAHLATL